MMQVTKLNFSTIVQAQMKAKPFVEIPGPKSYPIFGSIFNYVPPFGKFNSEKFHVSGKLKYELYGNLVREEILPGINYLFIFDPIDIETLFRNDAKYPSRRSHTALQKIRIQDTPELHNSAGLLPTSGEDWYNIRVQFQQALSRENVRKFIPQSDLIVKDFCTNVIASFNKNVAEKKEDFLPFLMQLALELVGQNFFGKRIGNASYDSFTDASRLIKAAEEVNAATSSTDMGFQLWKWIQTPFYKRIKKNLLYIESTASHYIQKYKEEHSDRKNLCILDSWLQSDSKDIKDVTTMAADMILAGIDTTSFTLSFILYHISNNPKVQAKLLEELKHLMPTLNSSITEDVLQEASYLKKCVKESLRLNPISVGVGRVLQSNTIIGGYEIPKDTIAVTMNQVSCRLEKYFTQPDQFIPERWDVEAKKKNPVHPFLILPFGYGPRACIGRRIAEQQLQIMTARIFRMFELIWDGQVQCLDSIGMINRPDGPLQFKFVPRNQ